MASLRVLCPAGLGLLLVSFSAVADGDALSDRRIYVAPMGSYTFNDNARGTSGGYGGEMAVGKRLTRFLELELLGFYTSYSVDDSKFPASAGPQPSSSSLYAGGIGANINFLPQSLPGLFLHLDVMGGQGSSMPGPISDYTTTVFDAGLGYDLPLNLTLGGILAPGMSLRVEGLYRLDAHGRGQLGNSYDGEHQYFQEGVVNLGLRIPLGGRPVANPNPPEQPTQVVPVEPTPAPAPEPAPPPPPPCQLPNPGEPVDLSGCKAGDTLVLRGVNFDFDSARLTVNAKTLLDPVADALLARPDIKVEIDGHTDSRGSNAYNQKLSERRAASVRQYLIGRGVGADRMTTMGYGESRPVADNSTDAGRELNRRVELKITDDGGSGAAAAGGTEPAAASDATPPAAEDSGSAPADSSNGADNSTAPADAAPADAPSDAPAAPPADDSSSAPPPSDDSSSDTPAPPPN